MLQLNHIFYKVKTKIGDVHLLNNVSLKVPKNHFMAIVGPSGCGKSTLLKTIAGIQPETSGEVIWEGETLSEEYDFAPTEIGYVPQFSIAYEALTVDESIESAAFLRMKYHSLEALDERLDDILHETGLKKIADRHVHVLSGGQRRRLGLAMELVTNPKLLLCDEVTSGLDPRSEREIVHLLHDLSRKQNRIVMSVTHSLQHLELYDSILVLYEGRVVYHGAPHLLIHYFSVNHVEEVYPALNLNTAEEWALSWEKHVDHYQQYLEGKIQEPSCVDELAEPEEASIKAVQPLPSFWMQLKTLTARRWKIFFRDKTQVFLQLAILICFPLMVIIFSDKASGNIRRYSDTKQNIGHEIIEQQNVRADQAKVGSAISSIIMFQVVLLSLMGANNSAREIAGERQIFEKEKFGGLRPLAYLHSKLGFVMVLVMVQSLWMATFVNMFGAFRGDFFQHAIFLLGVNMTMTAICMAISALMKTAEQSSLLSIYLVGFQLPLSGAVLALPSQVEEFTRPFISAYWAWSGSVNSLNPRALDAVKSVVDTSLSIPSSCILVLGFQFIIAMLLALFGLARRQWS